MSKITKVVIPVAGLGTRFLPATKAQPKEMLPVVDKPVIQYIVEEAVNSGIEDVIFITGQNKRAIEDHFDRNFELEHRLKQNKKIDQLNEVRDITHLANFYYVRQKTPKGDGHAILMAQSLIKNEPVVVLFGDEIIIAKIPVVKQLIKVYEKYQDPVIAVMPVPRSQISRYGIVEGKKIADRIWEVKKLIEKPNPSQTKSNLAIVGKYIVTPETISALGEVPSHRDDEIRLIDGFNKLIKKRPIYAYEFEGTRYDCGNKLHLLEASITLGLQHPEVGKGLRKFLKQLVAEQTAKKIKSRK